SHLEFYLAAATLTFASAMTVTKWVQLVRQCLLRRISVEEFGNLLQEYPSEIDSKQLFSALLSCRQSFCAPGDPLISLYLDHVGTSGLISISDALLVLISKWNELKAPRPQETLEGYIQTLQDVTMIVVSPKYKTTPSEVGLSLLLSSK